jgi:hypothetical protein
MPRFLSEKNEVDLNLPLAAMAMFPTLEDASAYLLAAHGLTVSPAKLEVHRRIEAESYEKAKEQMQSVREKRVSRHIARVLANRTRLSMYGVPSPREEPRA